MNHKSSRSLFTHISATPPEPRSALLPVPPLPRSSPPPPESGFRLATTTTRRPQECSGIRIKDTTAPRSPLSSEVVEHPAEFAAPFTRSANDCSPILSREDSQSTGLRTEADGMASRQTSSGSNAETAPTDSSSKSFRYETNKQLLEFALLSEWNSIVRQTLSQYGVPRVDLEEEVDNAFRIITSKWGTRKEGPAEPWIKSICFLACRNYRKKSRVRLHLNDDVQTLDIASEARNPEEFADAMAAHRILWSILEFIDPPMLAEVWWLTYFEEATTREICETFGVTERQARRLIEKADSSFAKAKQQYESVKEKERYEKARAHEKGGS